MAPQGLKDFAGSKAPKFGHFIVEFATPGIGHILKSAGCDFVLFDLEHSGFGFETVKSAIRYFEAADLPVIVRVPSKEYHHIARAMDMGAEGLMLPMVGTADEARHIVNSMKYTPEGGRGVALQVAHDRYRPGAVADKFAAANRRSTLFCQIETAEGVEERRRDRGARRRRLPLGRPFRPLGLARHTRRVRLQEVHRRDRPRCRRRGQARQVAWVAWCPTVEQGIEHHAQGFDFICYSGDVWVLHDALAEAIGKLREGCSRKKAGNKKAGKKS